MDYDTPYIDYISFQFYHIFYVKHIHNKPLAEEKLTRIYTAIWHC